MKTMTNGLVAAYTAPPPVGPAVVMLHSYGGEFATTDGAAGASTLTPRQREVLELLCEGLPNKLIGRRLNIASATVKIHVARILRALNVSSRLQAVIAARRIGMESAAHVAER